MKREWVIVLLAAVVLAGLGVVLLETTGPSVRGPEVVVYTSVDQVYSEPVFQAYEARTGVRVLPVYDVEATKTTGIVNRLVTEKAHPQADVFWNGEVMQTVRLEEEGVLAPYRSPAAAGLPAGSLGRGDTWTAFGGRARVILVNTRLLSPEQYPLSLSDLVAPSFPTNRTGIAYPLFGTTATHAAALYALDGGEAARTYFTTLRDRGVRVLDGNSVVRDQVADGRLAAGLTDSDDACGAVAKGAPVRIIIPDQGPAGRGTLVIPNSVALVAGAPHPEEGKRFIDSLLSKETEAELVRSGWIQAPARPVGVASCLDIGGANSLNVSYYQVAENQGTAKTELAEIFLR